jgi:hypothetical protein
LLGAIVVGIIVFAFFFPRFLRRIRAQEGELQLRRRCNGDVAQVERLIDYEIKRRAGMSRGEAISRAIDRLQHDNR